MADHVEPMDIDSDFDNKENSLHHNNVLPFTEKGYEELDVSELNMKLRYSVTPASSPMSKSYTANCTDNRSLESGDDSLTLTVNENFNLSHSLNSTLTKNDNIVKSLKGLPLQAIPTEQFVDSNRNTSVLRSIDSVGTPDNGNITVTVNTPGDIDENLSLPSSSSSALHTPEATTPTKDITHKDGGSPIMRGLKSVLNMFRSSQSPIPPTDNESVIKPEMLSPPKEQLSSQDSKAQAVLASTPIASHRKKEMSPTKRSSPQKDSSIVFNEDLEKELQWKDETTIIFSQERIPIHKLMLQQPQDGKTLQKETNFIKTGSQDLNLTVEYMDISYNDSFRDRTISEIQINNAKSDVTLGGDSDSEFVDCETTFTKNKTPMLEDNDKTPILNQTQDLNLTKEIQNKNDSGSRLKQIILDTTQDILDATLSVRPEDLLADVYDQTINSSELGLNKTETSDTLTQTIDLKDIHMKSSTIQATQPILNQTIDITNESEDPNCTKTIGVMATTQPNNETFDPRKSINDNIIKEKLDITKTLESNLCVTQIIETNELQNLNCTKTLEAATCMEPVNQTFDVASSLSRDKKQPENLDVTKTIENILSVTETLEINTSVDHNSTKTIEVTDNCQAINQTFDVASSTTNKSQQEQSLDTTKPLENVLGVTQVLESNESKDLNDTKTIEITIATDPINQTYDATSTLAEEQNVSSVTQILEKQACIADNLTTQISNATIEIEGSKNNDSEEISKEYNVDIKTNEIESKHSTSVAEVPIIPIVEPAHFEDSIFKPLPVPEDIESNSVHDVTMTELPVDIPLPDEDDLEKELHVTTESAVEGTSPVSLPLDLVDNIKITTKANVSPNTEIKENNTATENPNCNAIILPELCVPLNTSIVESDKTLNNEIIAKEISDEVNHSSENVEKVMNINEMSESEPCDSKNNNNILPEVVSSFDNNDEAKVFDEECKNNKTNIQNISTETINDRKNIDQINLDNIQINNNENACELKPLPDIINQTIAIPNTENINADISSPETVNLEKVCTHSDQQHGDLTGDYMNPELNVKEQQTSSAMDIHSVEPVMETSKVIEEKVFEVPSGDHIAPEELSKVVPSTADDAVLENVPGAISGNKVDAVTSESDQSIKDTVSSNEELSISTMENCDTKKTDEEIILSENNSPFVSVIAESVPDTKPVTCENESVVDALATKIKVVLTPPSSPPIRSKGYNFNFDDMDFDPFATKTNIRMSPPIDSPNKFAEANTQNKILDKPVPKKDINRRKSQPDRKKPTSASKRKLNATFDGKINDKVAEKPTPKPESSLDIKLDPPAIIALNPNNVTIQEIDDPKSKIPPKPMYVNESEIGLQDDIEKPIESSTDVSSIESNLNELKPTSSSSDQSTYYSACTTSSESSIHPKNVFNLPEIDDINFNPFATKSKMRQSPPPEADIDNPFTTRSKIMSSPDSSMVMPQKCEAKTTLCEDKIESELMKKDVSGNFSNASKSTDEPNVTTKEINTEDEDTVEGPFLENEDLNPDEKMSDVDGENIDMLQFNDLPPQNNEEILDNGEMFIDAEAFEFLLNQNKSNTVADSGKESLFLKFDPLFAKRISAVSPESVLASLDKLQKSQSTPTKTARTPPKNVPSPVAGPSNLNVTQDVDMNIIDELNEDINLTVSKPMMVVPPAVNPVTPRNKSITPNRSNRRSFTFTSPAMAVIDRLLSLSSNNSPVHNTTITQVSREQNEADIALSQLRELLAEKEINVYNLKCESNELKDRLNTLEGHVKSLEAESEDRLKKINQLNETLAEKTKINKSMAAVVEEYERTIASLIAETAQDKKRHAEERMKLINERDEQTAHLASMEVSFSDLHSKYEKSKQLILNCKANEDVYKKSIKEFEENLTKMQNNYELLKQHATSKLNHANAELEKINRSHEAEVLKLNAMIKRKELHITSLEESLAQKTKANDELAAICDEIINKVR